MKADLPDPTVLLTGAGGQVGQELRQSCPSGIRLYALQREALDIRDGAAVREAVRNVAPGVVINAAAYTGVDQAESDAESALAVNAVGARNVALAAVEIGARLLHLSTDFVFDGKQDRAYRPDDTARPLSAYGKSKLAGEEEVLSVTDGAGLIVRSSWIYSRFGSNFVKTMLKLMREKPRLTVVSDQIGSPTWAAGLAGALWELSWRVDITGIVHWADAGTVSWYEFALAIRDIGVDLGLLSSAVPVEPIPTEAYPTAATRPRFSALDTTDTATRLSTPQLHWVEALRQMLQEVAAEDGASRVLDEDRLSDRAE